MVENPNVAGRTTLCSAVCWAIVAKMTQHGTARAMASDSISVAVFNPTNLRLADSTKGPPELPDAMDAEWLRKPGKCDPEADVTIPCVVCTVSLSKA